MKNLKDVTAEERDLFTTEVANKLIKNNFDLRTSPICYGDYNHPKVENFFGMFWEGTERDEWVAMAHDKYEKLKREIKSCKTK